MPIVKCDIYLILFADRLANVLKLKIMLFQLALLTFALCILASHLASWICRRPHLICCFPASWLSTAEDLRCQNPQNTILYWTFHHFSMLLRIRLCRIWSWPTRSCSYMYIYYMFDIRLVLDLFWNWKLGSQSRAISPWGVPMEASTRHWLAKAGLAVAVDQRHGTNIDHYSCLCLLYSCGSSRSLWLFENGAFIE